MKKTISVTFIAILCLVLFFTQAFASSPASPGLKPKPTQGLNRTPEVEENEVEENEVEDKGPEKENQHPGRKYNFKGEVTAFDGAVLTISGKKGGTVTLDGNTVIRAAGPRDGAPTIQVGQQVMAQAVKTDSGFLALRVQIFAAKPAHIHRVGEVTDYQPGVSITVQDKKGATTFSIDPQAVILPAGRADQLQVGARVTIISPASASQGAAQPVAKGIVVHPAKGTD